MATAVCPKCPANNNEPVVFAGVSQFDAHFESGDPNVSDRHLSVQELGLVDRGPLAPRHGSLDKYVGLPRWGGGGTDDTDPDTKTADTQVYGSTTMSGTSTMTLYCAVGDHYWTRPSQRGRPPKACEEHK